MGIRGFSMAQYARSRAAAIKRKIKEEERYQKEVWKEYQRKMKALERERQKEITARRRAEREKERRAKEVERKHLLEERIEKKLRKQYGLPLDGTLVVVVETENRLLEVI